MKRRSFFSWIAGGIAATAAPLAAKAIEASQKPLTHFKTFWKVRLGERHLKVTNAHYRAWNKRDVAELVYQLNLTDNPVITQDGTAFEFTVSQPVSVPEFIDTLSMEERRGLAAALLQAPMAEWEQSLMKLGALPSPHRHERQITGNAGAYGDFGLIEQPVESQDPEVRRWHEMIADARAGAPKRLVAGMDRWFKK